MSFATLLINGCTIKRFTEGLPDDYGNPVKTWEPPIHTDEPCRLSTPTGREIKVGAEVVVADYLLFLGDIDITEQDRVFMVVDGVTVPYEVLLVARRQNGIGEHHVEAYLRTVR